MIVDVHTHAWTDKHITDRVREAVLSARGEWLSEFKRNLENLTWEKHYKAMGKVDKAIVFCWPNVIDVPNDELAGYVNAHVDKVIGFASVNPFNEQAAAEIRRCVEELGLKGIKLYPITQRFYPDDSVVYSIAEVAQELQIPILWHLSPVFLSDAPLKYSAPKRVDELAIAFPELKMIIAHLGFPWEIEVLAVIRKQPNVYADISGICMQHWRFYNVMVSAVDYGVTDKLLFGSDWPLITFEATVEALRKLNIYTQNTNLPEVPDQVIKAILEENASKTLNLK